MRHGRVSRWQGCEDCEGQVMSKARGRAWGHLESSCGWVGPVGDALLDESLKIPHQRCSWPQNPHF